MTHLKHVILKIFHFDDGMITSKSMGCRDVKRTTNVHRLKGNHHDSQFSDVHPHLTATTASKLFHSFVQPSD